MRRTAMVVAGLGALIVGCQDTKKEIDPIRTAQLDYGALQPELYVTNTDTALEPVDTSTDYMEYEEPAGPSVPVATAAVTHRVVKGDTLYRLARKYYSDQRRWKAIYEANRGALSDPNRIRVGQELVIP